MSSERQLLETESRWWGEHLHRYNEALKLIGPNERILDIACGTGFGSDILARHTAGQVTGGDISPEAIEECRSNWNKTNLDFQVLDGTKLSFPNDHFDKIVSFETIEHTPLYLEMLKEFARVLKPGGQLILSTPNAAITSPNGVIGNPFHTQEFRLEELRKHLAGIFREASVYGQRYSRYDRGKSGKKLGKLAEHLFLSFGIRKLPYSFRSGVMKSLFGYPLYPRDIDFVLESTDSAIVANCPVLFAVCKK